MSRMDRARLAVALAELLDGKERVLAARIHELIADMRRHGSRSRRAFDADLSIPGGPCGGRRRWRHLRPWPGPWRDDDGRPASASPSGKYLRKMRYARAALPKSDVLARAHLNTAAMARTVWALLRHGDVYKAAPAAPVAVPVAASIERVGPPCAMSEPLAEKWHCACCLGQRLAGPSSWTRETTRGARS